MKFFSTQVCCGQPLFHSFVKSFKILHDCFFESHCPVNFTWFALTRLWWHNPVHGWITQLYLPPFRIASKQIFMRNQNYFSLHQFQIIDKLILWKKICKNNYFTFVKTISSTYLTTHTHNNTHPHPPTLSLSFSLSLSLSLSLYIYIYIYIYI